MTAQIICFLSNLETRLFLLPFPILETAKRAYLLPPQYCNGFVNFKFPSQFLKRKRLIIVIT